jgi:hypothetical protein
MHPLLQLQSLTGNGALAGTVQRCCGKADCSCGADVQKQAIQRAPGAAAQSAPGGVKYYVIRDAAIALGGATPLTDLAALKATLLKTTESGDWTLTVAIHGSQDRLGAQIPGDANDKPTFYSAADLTSLFSGSDWDTWKKSYGPGRLVLLGCQVTQPLEAAFTNAVIKPGGAAALGLGAGCKPLTREEIPVVKLSTWSDPASVPTKADYDQLTKAEKADFVDQVDTKYNQVWGFLGGPPVPKAKIVDYLFVGVGNSPGYWPMVEVATVPKNDVHAAPTRTGIPFYNRRSNTKFNMTCNAFSSGLGGGGSGSHP